MRRTASTQDTGFLARWARFVVRRRWLVLGTWIAAPIVLLALAFTIGGSFASDFSLPGTESQSAADLLKARFPQQSGDGADIVFQASAGVSSPDVRGRIDAVLQQARLLPGVISVTSPFDQPGSVSQDGTIARATAQYAKRASSVSTSDVKALLKLVDHSGGNGLKVETGGQIVEQGEQLPPGGTEAIGLLGAVVILLIAFGSVVAMGLPLGMAIVGLATSFALILFTANFLSFPSFVTSFAAMIGIGVGIDYALLVVTRFREGLHRGLSVEDSVALSISTAGRSVAFAGIVVAIALLGLTVMGIPFIVAIGIGGAIVVAMAVLIALTLLPALLAFAGPKVDSLRVPFLHTTEVGGPNSMWYRFAARIQRRPLWWGLGALVVLLALDAPVLRMHLGFSDAGNGSTALHSRRAYDLLASGFGPGFNGPLTAVIDVKDAGGANSPVAARVHDALAAFPGIAQVSPPIPNQAGDAMIEIATPAFSPQDSRTEQLVHDLRTKALPPAVLGTGAKVYVAGPTAAFIDIGNRITSRLTLFFVAVLGLSMLLLMTVFRSVLVALKAAVMNILSIGASYGVLVAIFQWGWFSNIVGIKKGPIETFLPMMLFAILFGLSMDYEVFLISRIREEYVQTRNNADAVAHGLAVTARVITAAAAIMVVVFLAFVLGDQRVIKEFGVGLATAIFVDATLVRLVLVPATMELLGDANWWLPRWLNAVLPHLNIEGDDRGARIPVPAGIEEVA